jgi:molybdate transport system regulatory protein
MRRIKEPKVRLWVSLCASRDEAMAHRGSLCKGLAMLLRGVGEHGSLNAAAKQAGIAYSKAWDLLRKAEGSFGVRLTERHGPRGSLLSEQGAALLECYERLESECQDLVARRFSEIFDESCARAAKRPERPRRAPAAPPKKPSAPASGDAPARGRGKAQALAAAGGDGHGVAGTTGGRKYKRKGRMRTA